MRLRGESREELAATNDDRLDVHVEYKVLIQRRGLANAVVRPAQHVTEKLQLSRKCDANIRTRLTMMKLVDFGSSFDNYDTFGWNCQVIMFAGDDSEYLFNGIKRRKLYGLRN